ncbi:MAG: hypothetical protein LBI61_02260 [Puniceicoccales bacterium]|nr:hypothetical protein [Puniceicoccales bacterium]
MFSRGRFEKACHWLIFSKSAPFATIGLGGGWFLANVLHLSIADLGEHRVPLFLLFGAIILLSFFKMRDLLAVRGLAILLLVCAGMMLENVYGERILSKNFFVSFIYLMIIFAMVIGSIPYAFVSLSKFLRESDGARFTCAAAAACYGTLLLWISFQIVK